MTARALLLLLGLWLVVPLVGGASASLAQGIPEPTWICVECRHGPPHDVPGCPCCNPDGGGGGGSGSDGGGGDDQGGQGGSTFALELVTAPVVAPIFFAVGLGLGFAWMFQRLTDETDLGVFEYLAGEVSTEDASGQRWVFGEGALLLSGAVTLVLYLPVLGATELFDLLVDDVGEAHAQVVERAAEVRAAGRTAHEAFEAAHPPPAPAPPVDPAALAALDEAAARRARRDDALAAVDDVATTPPLAAPAWPTRPLVDPVTQRVAPPSARGRPEFVVPPLPPSADAARAEGVLERTRRLLREGAAEAGEELIDEVKDGALGLLPERVERALRANLAAQAGTLSTLERARDEAVPLLAFGSAQEVGALERDLERGRRATAERVLDEVQGEDSDDDWLDLVRRGLRAEGAE